MSNHDGIHIRIPGLTDTLLLDKQCWCCVAGVSRKGNEEFEGPDGRCTVCGGLGWKTTDAGNELLAFVRRHANTEVR